MSFTNSSCPSGAHVTDFFFLSGLASANATEDASALLPDVLGAGADGDGLRALMSFRASWNASVDEGCATFAGSSFFIIAAAVAPVGAFLKLGNFAFCLGAEKKDESDFDSFTAAATPVTVVTEGSFPSFLTTTEGRDDDAADTALFFAGGPTLGGTSGSLRFFCFTSTRIEENKIRCIHYELAMITPTLYIVISRYDLVLHKNELSSPLSFEVRRHVLDRCRIHCEMVLWSDTSFPLLSIYKNKGRLRIMIGA